VDFRLLGPLEVLDDDGRELSVGAGRQRALLALLVLRANEVVASDRLVDELWGESAPPTAHKMLLNHVSALRRVLGRNGRLETRGSAYRLRVAEGERDVDRFEELFARGRSCIELDPAGASAALRDALSLWRGPALSDLAYEPFAQSEIARLEERRLAAFEERVEAELVLGRHADLVAELEGAVARHPLRERLYGQLMLALYRCGRQAEALDVYRRARGTLVEEIGVEPGPDLRSRQAAILAQDPALQLPGDWRELPPGLDGGSPFIAGREAELAQLEERLMEAEGERGGLVLMSGPRGIGKTRLAAELARAALRARMAVVYAGAAMSPEEALASVRHAATGEGPALLVLDDADDASPPLLSAAAQLARNAPSRKLLVLVLHREPDPPPSFAGLPAHRIPLGPLSPGAVEEIAALYSAPGGEAIPAHVLAAEAAGVPLEAHRAASEWAREQAAARLVETAARAEAERGDMRAAEVELADNVIDLQAARSRGRLYTLGGAEPEPGDDEPPAPAVCPFLGLATFDAAHAEYFFGRERLVAELVARLVGAPLLAVVGPSGSGKSSVVRAGLLPALAEGALPGSERWRHAVVRPGERPPLELHTALERVLPEAAAEWGGLTEVVAALTPGERLVLTVDQFEETFTACRDEQARAEFVEALVGAARDRERRIAVVLAIRADFYGRCAAYRELAELVGANQVLVGPMRRDELRRAIELPARRVGLQVERALVDALIADVQDEPGGLPMLSTALLELWRERDGRALRRSTYARTGGVRGAVARLAEDTYARLGQPQQEAARRILLRLADAGDEAAFVRRRVPREELDLDRDEDAASALATLTESRLVTVDHGTVEVAHEALLREWPRLRAWLEEDAEGRRLHQHLIHAARDWEERGRDPGELYRGARLASTLDWASEHEEELNELERDFLAESRDLGELEAERQRRANRRLRGLLAGLGLLLVLALVAGVVALDQRGSARDEARAAEAQRLGVQALTERRLDRSLLLARQGVELDDSRPTRSNLLAVLLRSPAAIGVMRGAGNPLDGLDLSPDGRTLAAGDTRGNVLFLDAVTGRRAGRPYKALSPISAVRFSPDGTRLALAGDEFVDILDARTHQLSRRLFAGSPDTVGALVLGTIAFSPDSRVLAADVIRYEPRRSADIVRWDARTGRQLGPSRQVARAAEAALVGFIARGARLVTSSAADRATVIRDAATLRPVRSLRGGGTRSALSPGGRVVALGAADGSVRLLDLRTGNLRVATDRHAAAVTDLRFTPDSRTLLTAGGDGRVNAWSVADARRIETFTGHAGIVSRVTIAPDGRTAYSAGEDGTVIGWDLSRMRRLDRPFSAPPRSPTHFRADLAPVGSHVLPVAGLAVAATPEGDSFAVPDDAGYVDVFDSRTLLQAGRIPVSPGTQVSAVAIAPDGRTVAATTANGDLRFGDLRTGRPLGPLQRAHTHAAWSLAFSGDGRWLATAGLSPPLRLWDVRRRKSVGTSELPPYALAADVTPSPDGTKLAAAVNDGNGSTAIEILSIPSLEDLTSVPAPVGRWVQFSRDGRLLLFGDDQGRARLYDTRTWRPRGPPLVAHTGAVVTVALSSDGQMLATTSDDGTTRLWDVPSGRPIGTPLPGPAQHYVAAAFVDGGTHLVTLYDNGRGYLWDVQPRSWARRACEVVGRKLTRAEWSDALPERKYAPACAAR
jgi:WD40 repeat protein/DNA-binding SARP family transcriptional activator